MWAARSRGSAPSAGVKNGYLQGELSPTARKIAAASEKTPEHLGEFLGYFMIRKVFASQELLKASGPGWASIASLLGVRFAAGSERRWRARLASLPADPERAALMVLGFDRSRGSGSSTPPSWSMSPPATSC